MNKIIDQHPTCVKYIILLGSYGSRVRNASEAPHKTSQKCPGNGPEMCQNFFRNE